MRCVLCVDREAVTVEVLFEGSGSLWSISFWECHSLCFYSGDTRPLLLSPCKHMHAVAMPSLCLLLHAGQRHADVTWMLKFNNPATVLLV